jgi:PDZ domain
MRNLVTIVAAVLVCLGMQASMLAAPPARPNPTKARPVNAAELQAWLDALDDESYARREQATERLHAAGERAIDALAEGALSSSPEVAWRAGEALKRIAVSGNEKTIDRVAEALERVGKQGRSGVVQVVSEIRARQKQLKHDRAAAQIRRLGGGLSGGMATVGGDMVVDFGFPVAMPAIVEVEEVLDGKEAEKAAAEAAAVEAAATDAADAAAKAIAVAKEARAADSDAAHDPPAKEGDKAPPEAPAAALKGIGEDVFAGELSLEHAATEPGDELKEFRDLARLPLGAEEAEEVGEAIAIGDVDMGFDALAIAPGGFFFGGGFVDMDAEEGGGAESLMLDANWRGGDQGLGALRDLPDVTTISISGAKLGDDALKHFAALPKLSNLSIRGTVFSVAALRELHKARPNAYLFCQGEAMVGIHADTGGSCVLTSVYPGSGAADAGLRQGDKILAIEGEEIRDFSELTISVYGHKVGEKLKIEYERDGKRDVAHVELKARSVLEP